MKYYDDKASYRSLSAEESANYRDARDRELRKKIRGSQVGARLRPNSRATSPLAIRERAKKNAIYLNISRRVNDNHLRPPRNSHETRRKHHMAHLRHRPKIHRGEVHQPRPSLSKQKPPTINPRRFHDQ